jgi:lysophospholipase L1-like esterase
MVTLDREITVVHMGDSITFGQHIDAATRWTSLLADRLGPLCADVGVRYHAHNRGVSGETTRQGLERFPVDVQDLRPDIVTLQFGLNDCNCWDTDRGLPRVSARAFEANLVEMIVRARHFGARQIVLANNHRTLRRAATASGEPYEEANRRYSEIARGVADETEVLFCDIRAVFDRFDDAELADLLLPPPDTLHLSVQGNHVYADAIEPLVRAALAAEDVSLVAEVVS